MKCIWLVYIHIPLNDLLFEYTNLWLDIFQLHFTQKYCFMFIEGEETVSALRPVENKTVSQVGRLCQEQCP